MYWKVFDPMWDNEVKALGPIGLMIESAVWTGITIDAHLRLSQKYKSNEWLLCFGDGGSYNSADIRFVRRP